MAKEKGRKKRKEMLDAQQYREAVSAMKKGDMKAKTNHQILDCDSKRIYYNLTIESNYIVLRYCERFSHLR